jgi:hypothetical protein
MWGFFIINCLASAGFRAPRCLSPQRTRLSSITPSQDRNTGSSGCSLS